MCTIGDNGQNGVCKQRPLICSILDPSKLRTHTHTHTCTTNTPIHSKTKLTSVNVVRKLHLGKFSGVV